MEPNALVAAVRDDVRGGAAEIAQRALLAFEGVVARAELADVEALRAELARLANRLLDAQPAMAPLVALSSAVLRAASGTAQVHEARQDVRHALAAFAEQLAQATREVAVRAEGLIPAGGRVLTLSASSTVRGVLLDAAKRRAFDVICLESRPHLEGRSLAAALAAASVRVTLAIDGAVAALIRDCDVVLIGADSIGDLGVVNKVGTRPAALAARSAEIPLYTLADTSKILPPGFPQAVDDDRPPGELWEDAPPGVIVWNRYFEATPLSFFAGVVTEQGLRTPPEIEQYRAELDVPAELRARFAAGRSTS